jgi:hypothetical protein
VLLLALFLAATFEERTVDLSERWQSGGQGVFQRVELSGTPFVRLAAPRHARLRWNGVMLHPNADGELDAPFLRPVNLLEAAEAVPVLLKLTPRVFLSNQEITCADGRLAARLSLRNTLDNTVNLFITLQVPKHRKEWSATATVPPGVTQMLEITGQCRSPLPAEFVTLVEKQEEAMEPGYIFRAIRVVR